MPTVLDWSPTVDTSDLVRQVREVLAAGSLVVLPGDAGYVVLADPAAAAGRIASLLPPAGTPPAFLAYGPDDAAAFELDVPTIVRRLMFRAWPAPLIVALPAGAVALPPDWPELVRAAVTADGLVRFRCPDHPVTDALYPAVVTDTRCRPTLVFDTRLSTTAAVIERLDGAVGLTVSAGELRADGKPTVVRVNPDGWEVVEQGLFPADEVRQLTARIILFVCTGNTCRSPMAEGLAKKSLAERLGCTVAELPARGVWVLSAGVAAYGGAPASPESAEIAAEFGADIRDHRSRPVNPQLLAAADNVIAMTRAHQYALAARYQELGPAVRLLCGDEPDLDDPIGAGPDVYRECARTILRHLERFLPEWVRP